MNRQKQIHMIFYKGTYVKKENRYTWCGIIDKNGRMLKTEFLDIASEFFDNLYEVTQVASDMIIDMQMYNLGINKRMKRFFKLVSPELAETYLKKIKRVRARYKAENIYLYGNFDDAFYNVETYFKGILWMMTSLENFQNLYPYIDDIRILRVNHDFVELFGEDACEMWNFNDIVENVYAKSESLQSATSTKYKELLRLKHKPVAEEQEIWDNGMRIIKNADPVKVTKARDVPTIYDYHFETYYKMNNQKEVVTAENTKRKNTFRKALSSECTMNKNKLKMVMR